MRTKLAIAFLIGLGLAIGAETTYRVWPSQPPADCPFEPSSSLVGIAFTGGTFVTRMPIPGTPRGPPTATCIHPGPTAASARQVRLRGEKATTGNATIVGDDPLNLKIINVGVFPGNPAPYGGRYPCGSLVYNGVWYYGTYCLLETPGKGLNWDVLGPLVGFRYSTDFGKTWHDTPHTPSSPLFGEPAKPGGKVKMGAPHFVDFGRNMQYSPDGKAYLVGHGATDPDPKPRDGNLSWITGDQIYMARVSRRASKT